MIVFSCPNCDEPLPETSQYCPLCGESLISPEFDATQSQISPETDTTQPIPGKSVSTPGENDATSTPAQAQATAFKVPYFYAMGIDEGQSAQPVEPDESELTQPVGLSAGLSTAHMPVRPGQRRLTPTSPRINATLIAVGEEEPGSQQRGVGIASKPPAEARGNWNKVVPPGSAHLIPLPVIPLTKIAPKTPPTLPTLKPVEPKTLRRIPPPFWFWVTTIVLLGLLFGGLLGVFVTLRAHPPLSLQVTPSTVPIGGTITLHGSNFSPKARVGLMRDMDFAIIDTNDKNIIAADNSGSFTDTVFVDPAWGTGAHIILAEDATARLHQTASFPIMVTGHGESPRPPHLQLSQTTLDLGSGDQATNSTAMLTLADRGGGVISWQSATTQPWLLLSPQSGTFPGDQSMQIMVSVDRSKLSPGSYSGNIILTSNAGKETVSVKMVVTPLASEGDAVLQVSPAALSFTGTDGGANPPAQSITISDPGVQPLQWGTSTSTSDGSNWLTVSPQSGKVGAQGGSQSVKIGVNISTLLPGVYSGWVIFSNAGTSQAQDSPQRVFVSLTVQPQCALSATPGVITITSAYLQPAPAPTSITIGTNQGCKAPLQWTASSITSNGGSWLNIGSSSGVTPDSLSVSVNVAGLTPGTYNGQIMLTTSVGSLTLPVTFIMGQPTTPIMATTPASMTFSGVVGDSNPHVLPLTITNSGGGTLSWQASATTSVGGGWLSVAQGSGGISSKQSTSISVSAAVIAGLIPGTYTGTITITGTDVSGHAATGSPQSIPVTFTVSPACAIAAAPVALTYAGLVGGSDPSPQGATISASGACSNSLNWSASVVTSTGGAWLNATPSGSVSLSASSPINVGVTLNGLGAGTYTGTVTISATDSVTNKPVGSPQVIMITLDVTAPPALTVGPTSLTFNVTTGTSSQPITIGNSGGLPLNWSAALDSSAPPFVSLSASSGSNLAGGTSTSTNVVVNATGVTGGQSFTTSVTVSAVDPAANNQPTAGSPAIVSITINVAAPAMQVNNTNLSFTATQGGSNPASKAIVITNTGGDGLNWTVGSPSAGWLTAAPRSGSDNFGQKTRVKFSVDISNLSPNSYSATVTITPSVGSPVTVNVALTVIPGATPTPLPTPNVTPAPSPTATPTPQPSPSPTATPTPQPSPTATPTPQPSPTPNVTPAPSPTDTPTPNPTGTPTPSPTDTPTPTATASPTDTPTPTVTGTPTPTPAPTPTSTNTATPTQTATDTPTPSATATTTPSVTPSVSPTSTATSATTGQANSLALISLEVTPHPGPHVAARVLRSTGSVKSATTSTNTTPRSGPRVNTPISWPSRDAAFRDNKGISRGDRIL